MANLYRVVDADKGIRNRFGRQLDMDAIGGIVFVGDRGPYYWVVGLDLTVFNKGSVELILRLDGET